MFSIQREGLGGTHHPRMRRNECAIAPESKRTGKNTTIGFQGLSFYTQNQNTLDFFTTVVNAACSVGINTKLQLSGFSLHLPLGAMGWKAAEKLIRHWKILRGDNVMIIRGKDKGETGTIKRVIRSQNRVIVEGKNLIKKHIKGGPDHEGGIFTVEAPLHASNVQVVDPVTGRPCKVGVKYLEDGTKVRVARGTGTSGSIIPRPEILKIRATPRPTTAGPKDTPMEFVWEQTYDAKTGKGMPDL
ncbi:unnamed protein product [Arabidopsis arenosa]|nr:unnamed protein product [Arabidopsis arenosa]